MRKNQKNKILVSQPEQLRNALGHSVSIKKYWQKARFLRQYFFN